MKCPKCGNELRQLPKNPKVFYCKNCKKYFENEQWKVEVEDTPDIPVTDENNFDNPMPKKTNNTKNWIILLCAVGGGVLFGIIVFFIGLVISPDVENSTNVAVHSTQGTKETIPAETSLEKNTQKVQSETMLETESIISEKNDILTVGDSATQDDVTVTLLSVEESYGNDYITPEPGNLFLALEFEIENNSSSDLTISSYWDFEAYCDDYYCDQDISGLFVDEISSKGQLDGDVAAGKKLKGAITYQIPQNYQKFEISVSTGGWFSDDLTFTIYK